MSKFFLILLLSLWPVSTYAQEAFQLGKWGLRVGIAGGIYLGAMDNIANRTEADKSVIYSNTNNKRSVPDYTKYLGFGWLLPIQAEANYKLTDSLQLLFGLTYGVSGAAYNDQGYAMNSLGAVVGYRYYFNPKIDWINLYASNQLAFDLTKFVHLEGKSSLGFLFPVASQVGIFVEGFFGIAGLYNSDDNIGKGVDLGAGLGAGAQIYF